MLITHSIFKIHQIRYRKYKQGSSKMGETFQETSDRTTRQSLAPLERIPLTTEKWTNHLWLHQFKTCMTCFLRRSYHQIRAFPMMAKRFKFRNKLVRVPIATKAKSYKYQNLTRWFFIRKMIRQRSIFKIRPSSSEKWGRLTRRLKIEPRSLSWRVHQSAWLPRSIRAFRVVEVKRRVSSQWAGKRDTTNQTGTANQRPLVAIGNQIRKVHSIDHESSCYQRRSTYNS